MSYSASIIEKDSISGWQPGGSRMAVFLRDFINAMEKQGCTVKKVTQGMYGANVLSYEKAADGTRGYLYYQGGDSLWWGFSMGTICRMLELAAGGERCFCVAQGYLSSETGHHYWCWEATQEAINPDWTRILLQEPRNNPEKLSVTPQNAAKFTKYDLSALVQML